MLLKKIQVTGFRLQVSGEALVPVSSYRLPGNTKYSCRGGKLKIIMSYELRPWKPEAGNRYSFLHAT